MTDVAENAVRASRGLIGWMKAMASRISGRDELNTLDRAEFDQVARDLNLTPFELQRLSSGNGSNTKLLHRRMADFGVAPDGLTRQHPEVMRDLQRVCGMCNESRRCAGEFARHAPAVSRSDYCPNTQTLQALERENALAARESLPIGPSCC